MAYWTPKDYTPFFLYDEPTHTQREIRAEYSRLRDIAVKRAARFERLGLTDQADYLREMFPKLSQIDSITAKRAEKGRFTHPVADFLARGKGILDSASSSLSGVKKLQQTIFDETGEIVPLGKVLEFNDYMRSWRLSAFSRSLVPSDDAKDLYHYGDYQEVGGSFSEFYSLFLEGEA